MPITLTKFPAIESSGQKATENSIVVVPTKRRIRHLTREVLKQHARATSALPLFTLEMLAQEVLQRAMPKLRLVEEPILTLLVNQAIASSKDNLKYFSLRARDAQLPRGTFEKVVHAIRKLKEVGVYPESLEDEIADGEEQEQAKLADVAAIYRAYEYGLAALDGLDAEGIFKSLFLDCPADRFRVAFVERFPDVREISIVGFDEFTEPELAFIQKLYEMNIGVSLTFDFQHGNRPLFGHLEENFRRFLDIGFREQSPSQQAEAPSKSREVDQMDLFQEAFNVSTHEHIASTLFKPTDGMHKRNCRHEITIAKAKDRHAEVELICKIIKQYAHEHPEADLSRICVATYRTQPYTHLIREQFVKFGVPVNVTDRFELSQSPVVVSIVALLQIVICGFWRDDVFRALSSSYFDFTNGKIHLDRANLMNVSLALRIMGGAKHWSNKIEQRTMQLEREVATLDDERETSRWLRDINGLKKAQRDIQWLQTLLADIAQDQTPSDFERTLKKLLAELRVSDGILSAGISGHGDLVEKDSRAYAKFLEVVEQTMSLLSYQQGKSQTHSLKFFVDQLKVALSEERYNVREQFGQGVLATSIDETRGLPLDVMIVAGLVDGEFPSPYQSELFFSNKRLKEREQRHTWENRYLFYQAITNWTQHLYITYPEQDADLDLVRSSFVDAIKNTCEVEEWEYPGSTPYEKTMYSEEDFLKQYGKAVQAKSANVVNTPSSLEAKAKNIEHAIAVERSRVEMNNLPEYSGVIFKSISNESKSELEKLKSRVYSVSQLETYGKCPYQFFANRLLGLKALEEFEEEFSPLEKGSVIHEVLFEFYTERREEKLPPLINCSDRDFAQAHQRLLAIAERKLAEIDIPDAFWDLEKELILGDKKSGRGILREFLEYERQRQTSLAPAYFEVGFGSELGARTRVDKTFFSTEPVLAENVQLRGKVDRVEVGTDAFAIIDYKTGTALPKLDDIRAGISLQLPIYLYSIEKMLTEKLGDELIPAGGAYYQVRDKVALKVGVGSNAYKADFGVAKSSANLLPTNEDLWALIQESIRLVNVYVEAIARGKFPLTSPDKIEKVCTYCDYKTICRIQTVRRVETAKEEQ